MKERWGSVVRGRRSEAAGLENYKAKKETQEKVMKRNKGLIQKGRVKEGRHRASGLLLTMTVVGVCAVPRVASSGWCSLRTGSATAHREAILGL